MRSCRGADWFDEDRRKLALTDRELGLKIVDCGSGPASFHAEATR
jgi:hypothetical protein